MSSNSKHLEIAIQINWQICRGGVDQPGDLPNFWQDGVGPIRTLNIQFMDTKWYPTCSPVGVDFKYIFGFALCKGYDLMHKQKDALAHQF